MLLRSTNCRQTSEKFCLTPCFLSAICPSPRHHNRQCCCEGQALPSIGREWMSRKRIDSSRPTRCVQQLVGEQLLSPCQAVVVTIVSEKQGVLPICFLPCACHEIVLCDCVSAEHSLARASRRHVASKCKVGAETEYIY